MPRLGITTVAHPIQLAGTQDALVVIGVRMDEDFAKDPQALPAAVRRDFRSAASGPKRVAAAVLGMLQPTTP